MKTLDDLTTELHVRQRIRTFIRQSHETCPLCQRLHSARIARCLHRNAEVELCLECLECGAVITIIRKDPKKV